MYALHFLESTHVPFLSMCPMKGNTSISYVRKGFLVFLTREKSAQTETNPICTDFLVY